MTGVEREQARLHEDLIRLGEDKLRQLSPGQILRLTTVTRRMAELKIIGAKGVVHDEDTAHVLSAWANWTAGLEVGVADLIKDLFDEVLERAGGVLVGALKRGLGA